jgi:O-antigen/teichoic acid export membrane protein
MLSKAKILSRFKTDFGKNVLVLLTGTGIAQAIPILISPILTRTFSPHEFGVFGLYMACASILSVFSTGRYDLSIIEPKHDRVARMLMLLSLYLSLAFSILIFILVLFFNSFFTQILSEPDIQIWLYFLPISVLTISFYSVFSYWMNRKKMYKDMSINRVVSSTSVSTFTLLIGLSKIITGGLIIGYILGQFVTIILLKNKILKNDYKLNLKRKYVTMKSFVHYPKYLIPATLASELSGALPIFMVTKFFSSSITGFFSFANRVTALPISFIGNAIGEVYRQKAAEEYALNGNCKELYLKTIKKLFLIGLIPFTILFFFGETLFAFVFGPEWAEAGKIAKYLSFLIFFQLLSTPLAYTITLNKSQKIDMLLQFLRAIFSVLAIFLGYKFNNYLLSIMFYSIVFSLYYILHSLVQYRAAIGILNH